VITKDKVLQPTHFVGSKASTQEGFKKSHRVVQQTVKVELQLPEAADQPKISARQRLPNPYNDTSL